VVSDPRRRNEVLRTRRGSIYDSTGQLLAGIEVVEGSYVRRTYPSPETAYLIGYYSPQIYGASNLERVYDDLLSGQSGGGGWAALQRALLNRPPEGADLHLTIDIGLQQAAAEALGDRPGAVVVLNPKTGAVLAMVSNPHIDPASLVFNPAAEDWSEESARIVRAWKEINADPGNPLLLRATQGLYPPGSTFKTVTASAMLDLELATPETTYEDRGTLTVDSHVIRELNRPTTRKSEYTLAEAYRYSLNVVFAQLALRLGPERMREYAHKFGFDAQIPFDLPVARSQVANSEDFLQRRTALADTGYGQGELLATPLHMAMIAAAIANDGQMMQPYLVARVTKGEHVLQQWKPVVWHTAVSAQTAATIREMMVSVVEQVLDSSARIEGIRYGGKTGTAEIGQDETTHAWFIAYGPDPDPQIAISVVVEEGGGGGKVAAPIAKQVLEYALLGRR
jgi:peptidoglycan glycosyltransferase